jgi:hypothetical protein
MKGSASRPSSATMKGTRCAMSPDTNATSRESLSSLETSTLHLGPAGCSQGCGKLRPPIERVEALAGFGLYELLDDRDARGFAEAGEGCPLGLDPKPGAMLSLRGDPEIGNRIAHTNCIPPFAVCMSFGLRPVGYGI